jgi:Na+-driven multidrug efflux pump
MERISAAELVQMNGTQATTKDTGAIDLTGIPNHARIYLLALSLINLVLGILSYVLPSDMISFWPWPVKDLAVRFLWGYIPRNIFGMLVSSTSTTLAESEDSRFGRRLVLHADRHCVHRQRRRHC